MNLERYDFVVSPDHLEYRFFSEGPQGQIKKIVRFQQFNEAGNTFNLVFGNSNENSSVINDSAISNNHDADKILATVAIIVHEFTSRFPKAIIYAEGSTLSRTRLYQMGINRQYNVIRSMFDIFGLTENNELEPFTKGKNYEALLVRRRIFIEGQ